MIFITITLLVIITSVFSVYLAIKKKTKFDKIIIVLNLIQFFLLLTSLLVDYTKGVCLFDYIREMFLLFFMMFLLCRIIQIINICYLFYHFYLSKKQKE